MFKSYICLFTCATMRNVHLEFTPSMDASDVIKGLLRFLSRRGCIKIFFSDNFSSFKSDEVSKILLLHSIDLKFILPLSPWWVGFYERLVRTVKTNVAMFIAYIVCFIVKLAFNFICFWFVTLYFASSHFSATYHFYGFIHDLFLYFKYSC